MGVTSNRSAIGARVKLTANGATQVGEVRGGGSYYSHNDLRVHFGLGGAASIDRVEVRWPGGREELWTGVETNRVVTLTEGTGRPVTDKPGQR